MKLENLLLKASKGDVLIQEYNNVMAIYGSDFDENKIQLWLQTLQEHCAIHASVPLRHMKVQNYFNEVLRLTKLILLLPATNATH